MLDGGAAGRDDPVGGLLAGGEFAGEGGLAAGDDDLVVAFLVAFLVEAEEVRVGQGAEAGGLQVLDSRGGPLRPASPSGIGRRVSTA
ncbi:MULTISPECIES: hypothetical protein [unclassified Streptomyces]|uniref:hypothetical protein n=1 Tax=unclassified Streptomyces TaxID=2593676 RepID=UPI0004C709AC|nr:hypothetical protein [Streptomyces sp. NRRL F-2747]